LSTECALSGTSPQRNKVLIGSGSLSPGAGTTALPVAPIALTQNGEYRQGKQYICAGMLAGGGRAGDKSWRTWREEGMIREGDDWDVYYERGRKPKEFIISIKRVVEVVD
jgi:hypothetical protein